MKHYYTPTGDSVVNEIIGLDIEDAIRHNLRSLSKSKSFDAETRETIIIQHGNDEVYAYYRGGILGGKGGVEVVFRGQDETHSSWVECSKEEWGERGTVKIK